ncbi:MAG: phenylacetate--CoA ligase [Bacteroidales bacterium]|nr:phenylacetate--CoA ligase [Bacteroidales bacterium]
MNTEKYYQPEIETMKREDLEKLQVERLKKTIEIAMKSPFYGKLYSEKGITPDTIKTIDDIRKLPFTTKEDLRSHYPFGLVAADQKDLVRLHSSSGTTGNPTVIVHTQHDLDCWANRIARCLYMVGVRNTDVFQNSSGYGMFTGGLGFQYGAERLGCLTVPAAAGNSLRQIKFIRDFGTTVIHAIPSYASRLYEVFKENGLDPKKDTNLKVFVIGAEPHTDEQRKRIEEKFGVKAYNSFGMSEMSGPGVAFECPEQNGMHVWEDSYIVEIVDPTTLEPVADGEVGEMVITSIDRTGMPLIRYRSRDLTRFITGECPCGRTHRRLDRFRGRTDDMLILKGVNIFPMQIEKILMEYKQLSTDFLITLQTNADNDEMIVEVEINELPSDSYQELEKLNKAVTRALKDEILITPKVKFVAKGSLPRSEGKAVRVKDLRKKF